MNLVAFIKLLYVKRFYIVSIPLLFGLATYLITRDLPDRYTSSATLFTGITSNTGLEMMGTRIDNVQTLNEYNNVLSIIKSRSLAEETGLRLLAQHLTQNAPNSLFINEDAYNELMEEVPEDVKKLIVNNDQEKSYLNLKQNVTKDKHGFLYQLLNGNNPYYSVEGIKKLNAERIGASDLIRISYDSYDPAIAYNTIKIATEVFNKRYIVIKKNQSSNAIAYFQSKLKEVAKRLQEAEQKLLDYNISNNIINYNEQTEQITTQQEKLELRMQDVKMEYEGASAVVLKLESEIEARYKINLQNQSIYEIRKRIADTSNTIAQLQVYNDIEQPKRLSQLIQQRAKLEQSLQNKIDSIYTIDSKTFGLDFQRMMSEWINAIINYESNAAFYRSIRERHRDFMSQYRILAPVGATIKRYEREIDVIEAEYLNVQNNLNIALQKEQNMTLVTDMKMMDEASLPLLPNPSKNRLYILIVSIFSLIFYIASLLIAEILDMRIKTPGNLKKLSELEVLGAFCNEDPKDKESAANQINKRTAVFIFEKIREKATSNPQPIYIQILSIWDNAGKKETASKIVKELKERKWKVKLFNFNTHITKNSLIENNNELGERDGLLKSFQNSNSYKEMYSYLTLKPDVIISIIPAISHGIDNAVLVKTADINIIVFDSLLTWNEADRINLNKLKSSIPNNMFSVLSNGRVEYMEDMFGEIPRKRSYIRKKLKYLITRFIKV